MSRGEASEQIASVKTRKAAQKAADNTKNRSNAVNTPLKKNKETERKQRKKLVKKRGHYHFKGVKEWHGKF